MSSQDMRRLMRLVRELKFGEIYVNRPGGDAVHAHHAGLRHGRQSDGEDGKYGLMPIQGQSARTSPDRPKRAASPGGTQ
jgi:acyl-CoA reductase-like NAD-dependent aldehyde dehydrogenase